MPWSYFSPLSPHSCLKSTLISFSTCSSKEACLNVFSVSHFRNIAKHVTEFVLHGVGVLLNCVDLTRLLSLSAALVVCLTATAETDTFVREKGVLLAAIDRCSPSTSLPDDLYSAIDLDEDDTTIEIEPQRPESGKIRHISPFSSALRRRIAEKMRQAEDETSDSDSANILCSPKVLDYLEVYIFPLALLWSGLLLGKYMKKCMSRMFQFNFDCS